MKTIREVRHARLLELIAEAGSQRSFAERVGKSESQISQLKAQSIHSGTGKRRAIGDELARLFERKFDKPRGWMDTDVGVVSNVSVGPAPRGRVFVYSWAEADDASISGAAAGQRDREFVMAWHVTPSEQAFALRVEGDSMAGPGSPSFPEGRRSSWSRSASRLQAITSSLAMRVRSGCCFVG